MEKYQSLTKEGKNLNKIKYELLKNEINSTIICLKALLPISKDAQVVFSFNYDKMYQQFKNLYLIQKESDELKIQFNKLKEILKIKGEPKK
ncbi:hypothetical protein PSOL_03590 [Candidatus Phytoplasma solani]|uniref:hypothetical protein n=1 Tax=Candidatus Phytoplasma solani TaxID=69896 RepID=UPI0032DB9567